MSDAATSTVSASPDAHAPASVPELAAALLAAAQACDRASATDRGSSTQLRPGPVSSTGTGIRGLSFGGTSPDPNPITY